MQSVFFCGISRWCAFGLMAMFLYQSPGADAASTKKNNVPDRVPDEVGPNHRAWKVFPSDHAQDPLQRGNNPKRVGTNDFNRVVEIGTGMNYWDGRQYVPSDPRFDLRTENFVADKVQHAVKIAANINQVGAIKLVTPDGKRLNSTPAAIGLFDAESGRSVIIATITNSAGVLVDDNKVVFQNAFSGVCADIVYTLQRESFEQDVVFMGRVDPADYGFPAKTTRIQIYTEFYDAPRPDKERHSVYVEKDEAVRKRMASPDRIDETIGFGEFVIGTGRAYTAPSSNNPSGASGMVSKEMQVLDNRTFLVESVEYPTISKALNELAPCNADQASLKPKGLKVVEIPRPGQGKEAVQVTPRKAGKDLADLGNRSRGVTIDYSGTIGGTMSTATVFQGSYTYFVTGNVICNGPVTFEGGVVFKYAAGKSMLLQNSSITFNTSDYRPAVFTALDDDTIGETAYGITGYTGSISGTYANPALNIPIGGKTLSNLRFRYATVAISANINTDIYYTGDITVKHSQFTDCVRGISIASYGGASGAPLYLYAQNCLFAGVTYPVADNIPLYAWIYEQVTLTECTIHGATAVIKRDGQPANLAANVTGIGSLFSSTPAKESGGTYTWGGSYNGFYSSFSSQTFGSGAVPIPSNPFESAGAGNYYLKQNNNPCINAGPTTLTGTLPTELKKRTTCAPDTSKAGIGIGASQTWPVIVPRDTDRLDVGYHYPALDYLIAGVSVGPGVTLTFGEGVAVAGYGATSGMQGFDNWGFGLFAYNYTDPNGATLVSHGNAVTHNEFCVYQAVQEAAVNLNGYTPSSMMLFSWTGGIEANVIDARFTDFNGMSGQYFMQGWSGDETHIRDCWIGPGKVYLESPPTFMDLNNNVIESADFTFDNIDWQSPIYFINNTVRNTTIIFANWDPGTTIRDNLFENSVVHDYAMCCQPPLYDHNAYRLSTTELTPYHTGDVTLNALTYATGTLGYLYVASSTPSIFNTGSRQASAAGLYHYTMRTSQLKEGTDTSTPLGVVDIGFHYVAVNSSSGIPVDTDADGAADYVEDATGDGVYNTGDPSNWQVFSTDGTGLPDGWQLKYFGHIGVDPNDDPDGDGLTNYQEYQAGTNPLLVDTGNTGTTDGYKDSDGDGMTNLEEVKRGTNPLVPDAAAPIFSPVGGSYTSARNVTLTCPTAGASIYYSLDGTDPTTLYTGSPILVDHNLTLNAKATKSAWTTSPVESQGYRIEASPANLAPTITVIPSGSVAALASDSIDILVEAQDSDGTIAKIQLYRGSYKVAETTTSPLRYTVANVPSGTYTFTANAIDDDGAVTVSSPVTLTVSASGAVVSLVGAQPFFSSSPGTLVAGIIGVNPNALSSLTLNGNAIPKRTGQFNISVPLVEGENVFTLVANGTASATTKVYLDSVAPVIAITSPANSSSFNTARINVSGTFSESSLKQVTVNGAPAFINGSTFEALNVPLGPGANTITATATDFAGNGATATITVTGSSTPIDPVQLQATPVGGFAPLNVTLTPVNNAPGTLQQVLYDFNGDNVTDQTAANLSPITHSYTTAGQYFPVVTIQTTLGRFSSSGGWNGDSSRIRITVQQPPTSTIFLSSMQTPVDLKVAANGDLFVLSQSSARVRQFNSSGTLIRSLQNIGGGGQSSPTGIDVDSAGNVYVALNNTHRVTKILPSGGSFVIDSTFGTAGYIGTTTPGSGNGQFNLPYDVAISPDGQEIAVSDSGNHRIQRFTKNGVFLGAFGQLGSGVGQFNTPKGLAYDSAGYLYIVDSGNNRIVLALSSVVIGTSGASGTALGQFQGPINLGVGNRGIYVADGGNNRAQYFDPIPTAHGAAQTPFSSRGSVSSQVSPALSQPNAVAPISDPLQEKIYIADTGNNRVVLVTLPSDDPMPVWSNMKTRIAAADITGAVGNFSMVTKEDYRQAFLSDQSTLTAVGQIGALTPVSVLVDTADYYFTATIDGQVITFPVEFVKENGVWKILEF